MKKGKRIESCITFRDYFMNIVDFKVPFLIDTDAEIIKWHRNENDTITEGEILLELEENRERLVKAAKK